MKQHLTRKTFQCKICRHVAQMCTYNKNNNVFNQLVFMVPTSESSNFHCLDDQLHTSHDRMNFVTQTVSILYL